MQQTYFPAFQVNRKQVPPTYNINIINRKCYERQVWYGELFNARIAKQEFTFKQWEFFCSDLVNVKVITTNKIHNGMHFDIQ